MSAITTMTELMGENERLKVLLRQREEQVKTLERVSQQYVDDLAAMTAERDAAKVIVRKIAEGIDPMVALVDGMASVLNLEQQLARVTQERDKLAKQFVDMETYAKFKEQRLADTEARIAELEAKP
jgi:K+/H+ antiporter YhaU regulatory subunit KhtT